MTFFVRVIKIAKVSLQIPAAHFNRTSSVFHLNANFLWIKIFFGCSGRGTDGRLIATLFINKIVSIKLEQLGRFTKHDSLRRRLLKILMMICLSLLRRSQRNRRRARTRVKLIGRGQRGRCCSCSCGCGCGCFKGQLTAAAAAALGFGRADQISIAHKLNVFM
jgi:hypothetical protein